MSIADPDIISADGNRINQWSGAINGILTGYFDANRINEAINKAFAASPYLKTN
ncbi:MAG: DUF4136 domain-containing protein [Marinilabiliales bacterium]|nr:DUF4136 domain-containing protein [Marinilabiliales bacterium]